MTDFLMPSLGADMEAGTVVQWRAAPGTRVARGEIIAEVETEKGVFEVESPADGVVAELVVARGTKVPVGTVLAHIEAGGVVAPPGALPAPAPVAMPTPAPTTAAAPAPAPPVAMPAPAPVTPTPRAPRASPLARRVAEALGVDLATITGSGPDGAITRADVEHAAAGRAPTPPAPAAPPAPAPAPAAAAPAAPAPAAGDAQRAMRHAVALAVARSKREIPHYYLATDIDLAAATAWLREENARRPVTERVLPAALFLKAVARALRAWPALNGFWRDGAPSPSEAIHLGVAIALRGGGLVAPAIHDADTLPVPRLMAALEDLVRRAREGGLRGSEMTDPTITVTSLGDEGASTVLGVIYPPQLAIVGFGRVVERPWAVRGMLAVRPVVSVTLAADHRATDGHYGGRFLAEIDRLLQAPEAL